MTITKQLLILLTIIATTSNFHHALAQQTVGLFIHSEEAHPGYTLFAPGTNRHTYLIDNCGLAVNQWESEYAPGLSAYLLEDGSLLRCGRVSNLSFVGGGGGGIIERFSWDGALTWAFEYSSDTCLQHHDVEVLPNGNILLLAWGKKSVAEAIQAGRVPGQVGSGMQHEYILEIDPTLPEGEEIVWEWYIWDHLVQDISPEMDNYGVVAEHPELLDINCNNWPNPDWIHLNAVAYNAELDQIAVSSRNLNEIWIIDHSTTTAEAAGHTGGNSGKGGDLLYRWGNPRIYQHGEPEEQQFFGQHDVNWIPAGYPGAGQLMVFNNGYGRPYGAYSTVDVIDPPVDAQGNYSYVAGQAYGPDTVSWQYIAPVPSQFYSSNVSGARRLPNGNTLICEGRYGHFFEVDLAGNVVWDYVNPVVFSGPLVQGTVIDGNLSNSVFRVIRYDKDYPAFDGLELVGGEPIELEPLSLPEACMPVGADEPGALGVLVYPNPVSGTLFVELPGEQSDGTVLGLYDLTGRLLWQQSYKHNPGETMALSMPGIGVYWLRVETRSAVFIKKIIVQAAGF